jgi:nucleoside-diphosphate-sugar epimerase
MAYLEYGDRFEAVGIADLDHDNLTDVFKGLSLTLCIRILLITSSPFMIDVNAVILSSVPIAKGQVSKAAKLIVQSGSSGTRHVLEYVRAANVTKVIHTGSFANVLHPDDSWNPIVVTEGGR